MPTIGTMFMLAVSLVCVGVCLALPPFEIRSASSRRSEAAEDWIRQLQQYESCHAYKESGLSISCSDEHVTHSPAPQCVFLYQLCDGTPQCADGSDEMPFLCEALYAVMVPKLHSASSTHPASLSSHPMFYERQVVKR